MKKIISILISTILLVGMLLSSVSATAEIDVVAKECVIVPCTVTFTFKKECFRWNLSKSDFPELPVVKYEGDAGINNAYYYGWIEYDRNARIPVEEAMKKLAENPMIERVGMDCYVFYDDPGYPPVPKFRGDVNCDRALNAKDVSLMMKYILGGAQLSENGLAAIDVNGDGWVNAKDITTVMRWILEG